MQRAGRMKARSSSLGLLSPARGRKLLVPTDYVAGGGSRERQRPKLRRRQKQKHGGDQLQTCFALAEVETNAHMGLSVFKDGCIAASLYLASDTIAQKSEKWQSSSFLGNYYYYSSLRGLRYTSFGFLDGCISHLWFAKLDEIVHFGGKGEVAAAGARSIALAEASTKTALDFICFTPWWCFLFLLYMSLASGKSPRRALQRVKSEWRALYSGNVLAWLPANFVIYFFLPLELRVLGFGTYNVVYTTVLSLWAEQPRSTSTSEEEERCWQEE